MVLWLYLIVVLVEREHPYDRKEVDHDDAKKAVIRIERPCEVTAMKTFWSGLHGVEWGWARSGVWGRVKWSRVR